MDLGFHRAGFTTRWVCEVDPFRRKLLAKHFPDARQYPDLATIDPAELEPVDVLIGGTPCQDLSNAGLHAGLDGERSGLFWDYMRVRNGLNVPWCVWENVAGAFSSNGGLDFASVLGAFVGATVHVPAGGWGSAGVVTGPWGGAVWRLLDAQHFGVPQRRRRVFVVGHLGGPCPPEVLFEPTGSAGDSATVRQEGPRVASSLTSGSSRAGISRPGRRQEDDINLVTFSDVGLTLKASAGFKGDSTHEDYVGTTLDPYGEGTANGLAGALDCAYDPTPDYPRESACGDGVVAPVAEWIARRLMAAS